jgi:hypothetical protein
VENNSEAFCVFFRSATSNKSETVCKKEKTMGCECTTTTPKDIPVENKVLEIEFLYLDVKTCQPCGGTSAALAEALDAVKIPLAVMGITLAESRVHVANAAIAQMHGFRSSPTIKVAGQDIDPVITEDDCPSCGTLAGDGISVDCRTWHWKGDVFHAAPVGKIVYEILAAATALAVVDGNCCSEKDRQPSGEFVLPDNLKRFFAARGSDQSLGC